MGRERHCSSELYHDRHRANPGSVRYIHLSGRYADNAQFITVLSATTGVKTATLTITPIDSSIPPIVVSLTANVQPAVVGIPISKAVNDGEQVRMEGAITVAFPYELYIENTDRTSGIRVTKQAQGFLSGKVVAVDTIKTDVTTHERYIDAISVVSDGNAAAKPYGISENLVGRAATLGYNPGTGRGQAGSNLGKGTNNIGLLCRVLRRV